MPGLPLIGAEIPCSRLAINTPLRIKDALVSVDFRGGIKHRVDVNPDDPINSVRMRTVGHRVTAELPGEDGTSGGTITIEQNDVDVDSPSTLRLTQPGRRPQPAARPGRTDRVLADDGGTWLGTAVLLRAPNPDSARAVLTPDRYGDIEVHAWEFGGRR